MAKPIIKEEDLRAALPDTTSSLQLKGLNGAVDIFRDRYGIPHVRAGSVSDAFFGQGFATAQDRLWHMEHERRFVYGRWAEYVGESALAQDMTMRRFQVHGSVLDDYRALNGETTAALEAYAAGVNAFIESTTTLPVEYSMVGAEPERWEPWDCIAAFKRRHLLFGVFEAKLWRARLINALGPENAAAIIPGYQPGQLLVVPQGATYDGGETGALANLSAGAEDVRWLADADAGSNNWAVSGSRTASGKPLLAGDSHRPLDTPNVYYQAHIACPEFDAIGLSFPGCPGFTHFGHNAQVAWCVTHTQADYQDLYVERFRDGSQPTYETPDGWKEAEVRYESIEVTGGRTEEMDVVLTRHGPIIRGGPASGYGIAFKYTATAGPSTGLQCLLPMLRASSAGELDESMREWVDPSNNVVFADVHGDIGHLVRGMIPVRNETNAWLPVPGWMDDHEWRGYVPFDEMPRFLNPETGYISTANNRVTDNDYPHYIGLDFAPDFRARRIAERLKVLHDSTVEDMAAVHSERVSIPALTLLRLLSEVTPLDDLSEHAQQRLMGWNGSMDRDAVEPTIYSAFRWCLNRRLVVHNLGPMSEEALSAAGRGAPFHLRRLESTFHDLAEADDRSLLPLGADWGSVMAEALAEGVAYLRERLGDDIDSWVWGNVHFTAPRHPLSDIFAEAAPLLDPPSVSLGGDGDTPLASSFSPSEPFVISGTSVNRYIFDTSDWDNSAWAVPLGASGHPGSPHYADQAPIWAEVQLVPMLYDWDRIGEDAESRQRLEPEVRG